MESISSSLPAELLTRLPACDVVVDPALEFAAEFAFEEDLEGMPEDAAEACLLRDLLEVVFLDSRA